MSSENGFAADPESSVEQAETLLRSLTGVLLARVLTDDHGRIRDIHVLIDDIDFAPGQIARNVQSALLARFGTLVDLDRIRVDVMPAGTRNGSASHPAEPREPAQPPAPHETTHPTGERTAPAPHAAPPRLDTVEVERNHAQRVRCRLWLTWADRRLAGAAEALDGPGARFEVAARAAVAALNDADSAPPLELEGVRVADIAGRAYATVALRAYVGRHIHYLAGAAPVEHSPEDAAASATLQAAGPWLGTPMLERRRSVAAVR